MKKKLAFMFIVMVFALTVLITQYGLAKAEPITLKAVTAWPKTASEYKAFTTFTDLVEQMVAKKYPGELKIQFIGGPEAVKTPDQVQACQRGMVDMVFTTNAYYVSLFPEVDALKLSNFTPSEERASGAWAYMNDLHEKKIGIYYLARLGLGTKFHLYLKKPIKSADLKGLNIRVSPMYLQAIKGLGGNPVVIPPTEVYAALERNVVDGYCWPAVGIRDWGWQKHTQYVVDPGFYNVPNPLLINLKVWNQIPQKLRDLLTEAAIEAEKKVVANFEELARQERPILLKEGIQVIDLPSAEKEKFLKVAYDEGWKDILEKKPVEGAKLKDLLTKK
ncbi:MAG: C4-dicarboxylate transporter substrate-binding protein [Deltaproteobacteria bacterium]|jgi:TRAP-type C4-dicarboxylate transport system substrate-binding protein|nr:C4-dicarboxylate transporter substrate-binding protein [Deltaproteobacteria bacterium]